jgi:hypothetical protein
MSYKNYTIKELLDTTFIIVSDRGRFNQVVGKECKIEFDPKLHYYRIVTVEGSKVGYQILDLDWNILCYRSDINPEFFI